jgi:hypothetical protein
MILLRHQHVLPRAPACRRTLIWLVPAVVVSMLVSPSQAQTSRPTEYQVKAAYLYNFGKFVEWPVAAVQPSGDSFDICVLGEDPFGASLDRAVANETIAGKHVVARQIPLPQDAAHCQVLFISSSENKRLKQILVSLGAASVLTVSDLPGFTEHGGMVQFVMEDNKVRFEVNSTSAQRAGLTLSSELLKVATTVRKSAQLGD